MNTLATRKQSEAIRHQMQSIRSNLPYAMDEARGDLKQLVDWRYYARKMPLTTVACVATAAYLAVPDNRAERGETASGSGAAAEEAVESSFFGGLLAAAAAMTLRTGTTIALRHLTDSFMRPAERSVHS